MAFHQCDHCFQMFSAGVGQTRGHLKDALYCERSHQAFELLDLVELPLRERPRCGMVDMISMFRMYFRVFRVGSISL